MIQKAWSFWSPLSQADRDLPVEVDLVLQKPMVEEALPEMAAQENPAKLSLD